MLGDGINHTFSFILNVGLDIGVTFLDIEGDIKSVAWGLGNGDAVVERKAGRDGPKGDDDAPRAVTSNLAGVGAVEELGGMNEGVTEADGDDEGDESSRKLTSALHGEHGCHHGTPPACGSKLGRDHS